MLVLPSTGVIDATAPGPMCVQAVLPGMSVPFTSANLAMMFAVYGLSALVGVFGLCAACAARGAAGKDPECTHPPHPRAF